MSDTDLDLIERYTRHRAEDAFAEIVRRHLGLVYSAALRQVHSPQLAEEVAQSTFIDLARNAARLKPDTILTAWLYQVTRRTAIDVVRREASRQVREQIASEMNAMKATDSSRRNPMETDADWAHIEPLLDEAMHALDETDRAAVLLRYFENKSLREVGATLGTSDDAAQKRVSRAVERLREFFAKRGVTVGASGLAVVISANAIQAAPAGLAVTIFTATLVGTTIQTSTNIAVTKIIAMTTVQKASIAVATLLLCGATALFMNKKTEDRPASSTGFIVDLESYAGEYEMPEHKLIIRKQGTGIAVGGTDGGAPFVAYPQSEAEFVSRDQGSITKLTFAKDASRRVTQVKLVRDGRMLGELKRKEAQ